MNTEHMQATYICGGGGKTVYPGKLDMHLYPNPASGYLLVELKGLGDMEGAWLEMYDLQGRLVYRHRDIINGGQLQPINH
jgi:hypothetical protein